MELTKDAALVEHEKRREQGLDSAPFLPRVMGYSFYNSSKLTFGKFLADPDDIRQNLTDYVSHLSIHVANIFQKYEFEKQIDRLAGAKLLYMVVQRFAEVDLHPDQVSNSAYVEDSRSRIANVSIGNSGVTHVRRSSMIMTRRPNSLPSSVKKATVLPYGKGISVRCPVDQCLLKSIVCSGALPLPTAGVNV